MTVGLALPSGAVNVSFEGQTPAIFISGADTLIFFNGDPVLVTTRNVDWYDYRTGTQLQSNASTFYGADGQSVRLSTPYTSDTVGVYHIFDYRLHRPLVDTVSVTLACDETVLVIPNSGQNRIPAFTYYSVSGVSISP